MRIPLSLESVDNQRILCEHDDLGIWRLILGRIYTSTR